MKRRALLGFLLLYAFWALPAQAAGRFIVRVNGGLATIESLACPELGARLVRRRARRAHDRRRAPTAGRGVALAAARESGRVGRNGSARPFGHAYEFSI